MNTLALLLALLPFSAHAFEGTRGGGDDIGLEFQGELNSALADIKAGGGDLATKVAGLGLDTLYAAGGARALVVDDDQKVVVAGIAQDCVAVSDTASMVTQITRTRWAALSSLKLKEGIALHEALVLKGVEATGQYPISSQFLARFGITADSLLSGNPFPTIALGKTLTIDCKPKKDWDLNGSRVTQLYLVFDGKRGLADPVMVVRYDFDQGLPGEPLTSYEADLDSDAPGKIMYRIGNSLDGMFSSYTVMLQSLTFDFKALTLGAVGNGVAADYVIPQRGVNKSPVTHNLNCKITNTPPKG